MTKHRPAPGLTKAQYAAALAREQAAAHRAKPGDILAALAADCARVELRPDDITVTRVLAAGSNVSPTATRMKIMQWVKDGRLVAVPHCWDADLARYVTAYRAPEQERVKPPKMMRCPKCKERTPRVPPVCANCGADTKRKRKG